MFNDLEVGGEQLLNFLVEKVTLARTLCPPSYVVIIWFILYDYKHSRSKTNSCYCELVWSYDLVVRQKYNHSILMVSQLIRGKWVVALWIEHTELRQRAAAGERFM